ncbi:hypothetical protein FRB94_001019 [Tulasnella sp. JGI-2019a]|nr:hypothetical protein FRB94_001019 [Tulasnella sp. JGI-2019a]KAG9016885.1 hypothetical protein FRB93_009415 [Tulasnella sp. JGI-2019a]
MSNDNDAALTARFQATLPYHLFAVSPSLASLHAARNQRLNGGPKPTPSSCTRCGNLLASCRLVSRRKDQKMTSRSSKESLDVLPSAAPHIHLVVTCRACGKKDTKSVRCVRMRNDQQPAVRDRPRRETRTGGTELASDSGSSAGQTLAMIKDTLAPGAIHSAAEKRGEIKSAVPWKPPSSKAKVAVKQVTHGVRPQTASVTSNGSSLSSRKARDLEGMLERSRQHEVTKRLSVGSKLSDFLHGLGAP